MGLTVHELGVLHHWATLCIDVSQRQTVQSVSVIAQHQLGEYITHILKRVTSLKEFLKQD